MLELEEALCLSCNWKPEKFSNEQEWQSGSHAIAWVAIVASAH